MRSGNVKKAAVSAGTLASSPSLDRLLRENVFERLRLAQDTEGDGGGASVRELDSLRRRESMQQVREGAERSYQIRVAAIEKTGSRAYAILL